MFVGSGIGVLVGSGIGVLGGSGSGVLVGAGVSVGSGNGVLVGTGTGVFIGAGTGVSVGSGTGVSVGAGAGVSVGSGAGVLVAAGASTGTEVGVGSGSSAQACTAICAETAINSAIEAMYLRTKMVRSSLPFTNQRRPVDDLVISEVYGCTRQGFSTTHCKHRAYQPVRVATTELWCNALVECDQKNRKWSSIGVGF